MAGKTKTAGKRAAKGKKRSVGVVEPAPVIESGIPPPTKAAPWTSKRAQFPFAGMVIGDSFVTAKPSVSSAKTKYVAAMARLGQEVYFEVHWDEKVKKFRCHRMAPPAQARQRSARRSGPRPTAQPSA